MTSEEIRTCYCIPAEILEEYEAWKKKQGNSILAGEKQYDDRDLELLGRIMTLHEAGFEEKQVGMYLDFAQNGTEGQQKCFAMLQKQREQILAQIHSGEQMLERLDYLRYETETKRENRKDGTT